MVVNNETKEVFLCYDKVLRVHISRVEYFAADKDLVLLSEGMVRRGLGMRMLGEVARVLDQTSVKEIGLVRIAKGSNPPQVLSESSAPFVCYGGSQPKTLPTAASSGAVTDLTNEPA